MAPGREFGSYTGIFERHFGATWAISGDLGDPSKSKGVQKTTRKIQYGDFLAPRGGQEAPKSRFGRGLKKGMDFGWNFGRKMEGLEGLNHQF